MRHVISSRVNATNDIEHVFFLSALNIFETLLVLMGEMTLVNLIGTVDNTDPYPLYIPTHPQIYKYV